MQLEWCGFGSAEASKAPEEGILQRKEGKGRGEKLFVNKVVRVC